MSARALARVPLLLWAAGALILAGAGAALAYWTVSVIYAPTNYALGAGDAIPQGATPGTPSLNAPNGNTVTITFSPVSMPGPPATPASGYVVTRYPAGGGAGITTSASCSLGASVTCTEASVPDGSWKYTDAGRYGTSWRGAESALSASVAVDTTAPTVTINQAAGQADPTSSGTITFTAVFSETVTGFTNSDITIGGTAGGTKSAAISGSGPTYTVTISGATGDGTVTASIGANAVQDLAGNNNTASTSSDNSVTLDTTAPTVTINQAAGQADPTSSGTITFTAVFSETVTGFTNSDITIGGTASGTKSAAISGSGPTYTVTISGATGDGTVTASIGANAVQDLAANNNAASTSTDNTVTLDTTAPAAPTGLTLTTATDSGSSSSDGITNVTSPTFTGSAEASSTITLYSGTTVVGTGSTNGSGVFTAAISPALGEGSYTITAKATDAVGNVSPASTGKSLTIDTTAPTGLTITATVGSGQKASFNGNAGRATNDVLTVTVVVCSTNSFPCASPQSTFSSVSVNASTGAWATGQTSPLGNNQTHYAQVTQTDVAGNVSAVVSSQFAT